MLDLDPPEGAAFDVVVADGAAWCRQALTDAGLAGAVKTSGAKGVHIFVPLDDGAPRRGRRRRDPGARRRGPSGWTRRWPPRRSSREDREGKVFLDSTRAGGATVVAAYSPRVRPGVPVSFPVAWDDLDRVTPADFTVRPRRRCSATRDPWRERCPRRSGCRPTSIEEGHEIPIARVQAMHEGKRRGAPPRRATRDCADDAVDETRSRHAHV